MIDLPMNQALSLIRTLSPAWILVVLLGALWTGIATVAVPPSADRFPRILFGTIVGGALGQLMGNELARSLLMLGDVHLVAVSLGSALALGVVRRLTA